MVASSNQQLKNIAALALEATTFPASQAIPGSHPSGRLPFFVDAG
jgi:hypothetical protein